MDPAVLAGGVALSYGFDPFRLLGLHPDDYELWQAFGDVADRRAAARDERLVDDLLTRLGEAMQPRHGE